MKGERTVYFPFAPGVPYRLKRGIYVVPRLDFKHWNEAINGKTVTTICYGGFLENIMSLTFLEAVNELKPSHELNWICDFRFKDIWKINGLGSEAEYKVAQEQLLGYPVPLFFDANSETAYFNCIDNYINIKTYYGESKYHDKKAICHQVFRNSMVDWSLRYLPKMRNLFLPEGLSHFKFDFDKRFILLMPDTSGLSSHNVSCLNWKVNEVKSFAAMLQAKGYNLVILTPNTQKYYGIKALVLNTNIDFILFLLEKASIILSKDVDFLIASMLLGNAKVFSIENKNEYKIQKNKKFLCVENEIFTSKELSPYLVFQEL